jgi:hypothetical protein
VFDVNGNLIRRVALAARSTRLELITGAASFGHFANRLLVGSFGDASSAPTTRPTASSSDR